jgi:hypothetical protein
MATKLNIMTCLQQAKGLAEIAHRSVPPHSLGQLTLRAPATQATARRGLTVSIEIQNPQDAPYPARIVHVMEPAPVPTLSV